jgi:hypothetical protein
MGKVFRIRIRSPLFIMLFPWKHTQTNLSELGKYYMMTTYAAMKDVSDSVAVSSVCIRMSHFA